MVVGPDLRPEVEDTIFPSCCREMYALYYLLPGYSSEARRLMQVSRSPLPGEHRSTRLHMAPGRPFTLKWTPPGLSSAGEPELDAAVLGGAHKAGALDARLVRDSRRFFRTIPCWPEYREASR